MQASANLVSRRFWCAPAAHPLLTAALPGRGIGFAELQCRLSQPSLGFLWDHQASRPFANKAPT